MTSQPVGSVPGTLIDWAAGIIGIPPAVVRAQINDESGGQPGAVSPTGAQGVAQFEPGTWRDQACSGSPFNVNDAMKCYAKYMYALVKQFHGNIRDALAAYNAGPGNLQAGYGYADSILRAAGQPGSLQAGAGSGAGATAATLTAASSSAGGIGGTTDPGCAFGIHGGIPGLSSIPLVGGAFQFDLCFMRKTTIRHLVGGALIAAGGLVAIPGVILLAAFSFKASGAQGAVQSSAGQLARLPVYGRAVRWAAP